MTRSDSPMSSHPAVSSGPPDAPAIAAPAGFRRVRLGGGFLEQVGPLYARWTGERLQLGFRVEERHANPLAICHGGMMATLADMLVPCAAMYQLPSEQRFLPTISLQIDYLGPAPVGSWVQGEAEVLRVTGRLLFGQALATADGQPALRVSGIFKLGPAYDRGDPKDPLGVK
ncbi:MAG: PaaI family thioesterase [Rhodoferax sp.]|nr:PaaI family thioesterase [Rhodoferax sp.]